MANDKIDIQMHRSAFPTGYTGKGTLVGNPHYTVNRGDVTGYFTSANNAVELPMGFAVSEVEIFNVDDNVSYVWKRGLAATKTIKTVAAGTRTLDTGSAIVVATDTANGISTVTLSAGAVGDAKTVLYRIAG